MCFNVRTTSHKIQILLAVGFASDAANSNFGFRPGFQDEKRFVLLHTPPPAEFSIGGITERSPANRCCSTSPECARRPGLTRVQTTDPWKPSAGIRFLFFCSFILVVFFVSCFYFVCSFVLLDFFRPPLSSRTRFIPSTERFWSVRFAKFTTPARPRRTATEKRRFCRAIFLRGPSPPGSGRSSPFFVPAGRSRSPGKPREF